MKILVIYNWVTDRFEFYEFESSLYDLLIGIAELYCSGTNIELVGITEKERLQDLLFLSEETIDSYDAIEILKS